jgi:nitroreductase
MTMLDNPAGETLTDAAYRQLKDLLTSRYSCRAFREDQVDELTIRRMLEAAQLSATWNNCQPWDVIVTSGPATDAFREGLLRAATSEGVNSDIPIPVVYEGKYKARRREAGLALYAAAGIERADHEGRERQSLENFRLFGAPHALIVHAEAVLGPYAYVDCGAYIANFLLAAQALGVAAIPQAAIAMQSRFLHEHFGIGPERVMVAGISFGYAAPHRVNAVRTSRAPLDEVVTWLSAGGAVQETDDDA